MKIWVDADACPNVVKEILFRVANRVGGCCHLSGKPLRESAAITAHQINSGGARF